MGQNNYGSTTTDAQSNVTSTKKDSLWSKIWVKVAVPAILVLLVGIVYVTYQTMRGYNPWDAANSFIQGKLGITSAPAATITPEPTPSPAPLHNAGLRVDSVYSNWVQLTLIGTATQDVIRYNAASLPLEMGLRSSVSTDTISDLIPSAIYAAAVERNGVLSDPVTFETKDAENFRDDTFRVEEISIYNIPKGSADDFMQRKLSDAIPIGNKLFEMEDLPFADQTSEPLFVMELFSLLDNQTIPPVLDGGFKLQFTLKQDDDESIFFVHETSFKWDIVQFDGVPNYPRSSFYCPLGVLLGNMYRQSGNTWPTGHFNLEVYLEGKLLKTLSFMILL